MKLLDIAEVSRRSGIPASTLRFYEEKRLIESVGRRGLRRLFEPGIVARLALIALAQASGFSLKEIASMLGDEGAHIDRGMLANKAEDLTRTIRRLTAMRDGLRHAAECPAPSHFECPKFHRLVQSAATGAIRERRGSRLIATR